VLTLHWLHGLPMIQGLKSFCLLAGDRHIVVPAEFETQFRRACVIGYSIPANN